MPRPAMFDPCPLPDGSFDKKPLDEPEEGSLLSSYAQAVGARVGIASDGRVIAQFSGGKGDLRPVVMVYKNRGEATVALRQGGFVQQELTRHIGAAERTVQTGQLPAQPSPSLDAEFPPPYALMLEQPSAMDSLSRWTSGVPDPIEESGRSIAARALGAYSSAVGHWDFMVPVKKVIGSAGEEGREFVRIGEKWLDQLQRVRQYFHAEYLKAIEGLTPEELLWKLNAVAENLQDRMTPEFIRELELTFGPKSVGKFTPIDPERIPILKQAHERLLKLSDMNYEMGERIGLKMAPKEQRETFWHRVYDYGSLRFPHEYDRQLKAMMDRRPGLSRAQAESIMENLGYGTSRHRIVEHEAAKIMARDPNISHWAAMQRAEAVVDRTISKIQSRKGSHLERERVTDWPGYSRDARTWDIALQDGARRITEAVHFGPNDELIEELIGRMRARGLDHAANVTGETFDYMVGKRRLEDPWLVRFAMRMQTVKLGMSFLANASGNMNTLIRFGVRPMAEALDIFRRDIAEVGANPYHWTDKMLESGAGGGLRGVFDRPAHTMIFDAAMGLEEEGIGSVWMGQRPSTIFGNALDNYQRGHAALFNMVELYMNRNFSYYMGQAALRQAVRDVERSVTGSLRYKHGLAQIRELGFDPDMVLRITRSGNEKLVKELMTEAGAAGTIATQFRGDFLNMPRIAQTQVGRAYLQFRTFAINQTRFILDELFAYKKGMPDRTLRALGMMMTAMPAWGLALNHVRSHWLYGPTLTSETIDKLMASDDWTDWMMGGALAFATSGTLGLATDLVVSSLFGNKLQLMSFVAPVSATSFFNYTTAMAGFIDALGGNERRWEGVKKSLASELGGAYGATLWYNTQERNRGT